MKRFLAYFAPALLFLVSVTQALGAGGGGNSSACEPGRICNPLKATSITDFLAKILDVLVIFATPIVILFIMYAGFLFVTAKGDTGKVEDAKQALLWSVVGGVIVLGANLIAEVIKGTVSAL